MAAVDWFAPAAVAEPVRAPQRGRSAPVRRAPRQEARARRPHVQRRVRGHIVWMVLFAVLLAGVVAVNVAVLRANVAVHRLDVQRAQLEAQNEALASQLSAASSALRVEAAARKLGLVQAPATDTSYLDLLGP